MEKREREVPGAKYSFAPVVDERADTLVLGSLPGEESLRRGEYYGHPANHFWRLIYDVFEAEYDPVYAKRIEFLQNKGIALWDVVYSAARVGSLDSNIKDMQVNDFDAFFKEYGGIKRILFNGATAHKFFARSYPEYLQRFHCTRLPSTSPIPGKNRNYQTKLEEWSVALKNGG